MAIATASVRLLARSFLNMFVSCAFTARSETFKSDAIESDVSPRAHSSRMRTCLAESLPNEPSLSAPISPRYSLNQSALRITLTPFGGVLLDEAGHG